MIGVCSVLAALLNLYEALPLELATVSVQPRKKESTVRYHEA
jgi:hypothetical protein